MTFTCKTCGDANLEAVINDLCCDCHRDATEKWKKRMAIRQDPAKFNMDRLIRLMLTQHWMHECEIIPDYMPPYPGRDTRPTCVVRYTYDSGSTAFLRHSVGPLQGYFWDAYGEDLHTPEMALICISQAPAPPRVHAVIATHGT